MVERGLGPAGVLVTRGLMRPSPSVVEGHQSTLYSGTPTYERLRRPEGVFACELRPGGVGSGRAVVGTVYGGSSLAVDASSAPDRSSVSSGLWLMRMVRPDTYVACGLDFLVIIIMERDSIDPPPGPGGYVGRRA